MRHLLMDPAFPDLVAEAARAERERELEAKRKPGEANDNSPALEFLDFLGRMEIASTRLW